MVSGILLGAVTDGIIGGFAGKIGEKTFEALQNTLTQDEFKTALGRAIQKYAENAPWDYRNALLREDGPLTYPPVLDELRKIIHFSPDEMPDAEVIGFHWKDSMESISTTRNFANEAQKFIDLFTAELQATEAFRTAFETRSLNEISLSNLESNKQLSRITKQLDELMAHSQKRTPIHHHVEHYRAVFKSIIIEKTNDFIGRKFIFEEIDQFIEERKLGCFTIRGKPGIGKSAIAAELVRRKNCLYHFNIRAEGINRPEDFLTNICSQLIVTYGLDYSELPPETAQNSGFLKILLDQTSEKLASTNNKCIIVIDGLDEVEESMLDSEANTLYIPKALPDNIFLITTSREEDRVKLPACNYDRFLDQYERDNENDIRDYILTKISSDGIQNYIEKHEIDDELFVDHMSEKSEGIFIYTRLVLPEIEEGAYQDLEIRAIPKGLQNYYEDHWRRMIQRSSKEEWRKQRLPIIVALTVVKKPISIGMIALISENKEKMYIIEILKDFKQFLNKETVDVNNNKQSRYRWYHESFFDFIEQKDQIEEGISLLNARQKIAQKLRRF